MSDADLSRLRRDLDVIQSAAGLEPPFGQSEIWLSLALVPSGAIIAAWAAFGPYDYISVSLLPLLLSFLAYVGVWGLRYRRHVRERREHTFEAVSAVAFLAAMACLVAWDRMFGLPRGAVMGAGFTLAGIMFIPLAFSSPVRRVCLACPVLLIPVGLALPFCTRQQTYLVAGLAVMVSGLVGTGIMAWQLRASRRGHGPTTD
jgi:hypothetical protein